MNCRQCKNVLTHVFCDLQTCPPSNAMVKPEMINFPENSFSELNEMSNLKLGFII